MSEALKLRWRREAPGRYRADVVNRHSRRQLARYRAVEVGRRWALYIEPSHKHPLPIMVGERFKDAKAAAQAHCDLNAADRNRRSV